MFGSVPWTTFRVPQTEGLGLGLRVYGSEFRVKGLGFRVSGFKLGFRVSGCVAREPDGRVATTDHRA